MAAHIRLGLLGISALLVSVATASAATISVADIQSCGSGQTTCVTADGTVTSGGGDITWRTLNGWTGVGVGGGAVDAEIDGSEYLDITFNSGSTVSALELVFLYDSPAWGDQDYGAVVDETAIIEAFFGGSSLGYVTVNVTGATTANTTGGTITNISPGNEASGGVWTLLNPFGSQTVTSIRFMSGDPGPNATYSDLAIGDTTFQPVPEPASLTLFGLGLGALAARARRRRRV